ncbi:MAG: outer membrane beta-barrel protein [Alphaproteobacteria bacterium]|nr:outer membrane beta-barrel protein [Alphaproteobacteria bacterium]
MAINSSRFTLTMLIAVGVTVATASAQQQRPRATELPAGSLPSWTGLYGGVAVGGGAMVDRVYSSAGGVSLNSDGLGGQGGIASIYGGVDYQILPRAVIGVLAEGSYFGLETRTQAQAPDGSQATALIRGSWNWAALVRAGILPTPSTLAYVVGGYTGQSFHSTGTATSGGSTASFERDDTFNGWTLGTGLEAMVAKGWSTKLEYRYSQYETRSLGGTSIDMRPTTHAVRLGLAYKFGGFGESTAEEALAPEAPVDWTGIYLGGSAGLSSSVDRLSANFGNANATVHGGGQALLGSGFAGADYQVTERAVIGALGDVAWAGSQSVNTVTTSAGNATITSRPLMSFSLMGRAGYLVTPATLLYGAFGYTGEYVTTTATATSGGSTTTVSRDDYVNGWTAGPGIETVVSGQWTTRLEYRYSQYEEKAIPGGLAVQPSSHAVRAGLAYKFGAGKSSPNN